MLTRLEVSGFKNLLDLKVDFGPFTCIAGPNGAGKSNVFDCIHFLSLLADHEFMTAAQKIRTATGRAEDPRHLLWTNGEISSPEMKLAVEMIVPRFVQDDFGREAEATTTFLRYELELAYESPTTDKRGLGRLRLQREDLTYIKRGDAHAHLRWPHSKRDFRDHVIEGHRRGSAFISTDDSNGKRTIQVHQDGGSRGNPKPWSADSAPRTIVCTTTTASEPTILAARREMQSWRLLMLEPSAMRSPDSIHAMTQPYISSDGSHLAAALYRLATTPDKAGQIDEDRLYGDVMQRVARLLEAKAIRVARNDQLDTLTLEMQQPGGAFLPARALSDGTLRFLALCIIHQDPTMKGLLCMEEPENGIHPERMPAMVDLVRDLAVDPNAAPGDDNPLRQVIVNSHSPTFVQLQRPEDLLFAKTATVRGPKGRPSRTLRLVPVHDTWRAQSGSNSVNQAEILAYLSKPIGAQMSLDDFAA
jgi:predicted ATPase